MFPFHTWLPDAHVEAPTAGSVILAGILLKLGTYGFYRFNLPMFPGASRDQSNFGTFGVRSVIVFLAIVSIIYGALAAMYFVVKKDGDVKKLVAYSSVSSMGMVMLGLFALNPNGVNGGVMQMINHGIYSGALFLLVGIIYERRHTRNVAEFGGLSHVMPGYAAIFLGMVMTAIGLPLLAVFISEFLALRGSFEANPYWAAWAALGIILNAGYFLWLYQRMFFGNIDNPKNESLTDLNIREWAYMVPLMILSLWIGVYPKPFLEYIQQPVNAVVKQVRPDYVIPGMPAPRGDTSRATKVQATKRHKVRKTNQMLLLQANSTSLISAADLQLIAPELILTACACVALVMEVILPYRKSKLTAYFSLVGVALAFASLVVQWWTSGSSAVRRLLRHGADRRLRTALQSNLSHRRGAWPSVSLLVSSISKGEQHGEYYALVLFATVGMMFIACGYDLISLYISLELMALTFYVLVAFTKREKKSNEAAMKYFLLGAFSSGVLLYGMSLLYGIAGSTNIGEIANSFAELVPRIQTALQATAR